MCKVNWITSKIPIYVKAYLTIPIFVQITSDSLWNTQMLDQVPNKEINMFL